MSQGEPLHLVVAAFPGQAQAEEALKQLRESRDETLIGIQAAVALCKDEAGQIHFRDVGLTPAKGAASGVVLGAVVGILTGGSGLALGALGAFIGGLVGRKRRDGRFPAERVSQIAASLAPDSSAIMLVMATGWLTVVEEHLILRGGKVLTADIPADFGRQLDADQEAAYAALLSSVQRADV